MRLVIGTVHIRLINIVLLLGPMQRRRATRDSIEAVPSYRHRCGFQLQDCVTTAAAAAASPSRHQPPASPEFITEIDSVAFE